jgi:hypothetical protein
MGQKWYQATVYDLPISCLVFFILFQKSVAWYFLFYFKGPWPFKFKEMFFSGLLLRGVFGKCGVRCKFND